MSVKLEENIPNNPSQNAPPNISNRKFDIRYPPVVLPDDLARKWDFSNVCRICATEADNVLLLYKPEGEEFDMVGKIRKYLSIKVSASEFMPQGICSACASALLSWHELVRSARIADFMLRRRLGAAIPPPGPRPSASAGSEVVKDGVNESFNWNVIEIKEDEKNAFQERSQTCNPSFSETFTEPMVTERPRVVINENGKRYVSCDTCKKNVATSSWQRHLRAHRGERRYSCHACGMAFSDSGNLARHARARHARLRPHTCVDCGRAFARKTHLQDHMRSHRDNRDYVCDVCGKASKSAAALRMHVRTHDAPYRFHCMECGSKFKRNTELRAHVTIHTGERAHLCGCGRAFRLRSQLTAHARSHDEKLKLDGFVDAGTDPPEHPTEHQCSICSLMVPAKRFNKHLANKHSDVLFRCEECLSYLNKDDLLFHMTNHAYSLVPDHLKAEYYKNQQALLAEMAETDALPQSAVDTLDDYFRREEDSSKCDPAAGRKRRVEEKVNAQEPDESKGRVKTANDATGPANRQEGKEIKTEVLAEQDSDADHSPPKRKMIEPKRSPDTGSSLAKRQKKNKRVLVARRGQRAKDFDERDDGNDGDDEVNTPKASLSSKAIKIRDEDKSPKASRTCPICGKQYRASSSYFYHMKYFHKRSREHECPVCNKKFGTKANLAQHASIHTGAYDLECKQCGKRFKSKPSLYIHEQSHGGPKRWACAQCGRSFRWRTHLARHVTRHAAERAHVCVTCGRGFSVRCDLLRHARTHAADEFHCATCGLKFAQKRYLQVHVVKKHPEVSLQVETRS